MTLNQFIFAFAGIVIGLTGCLGCGESDVHDCIAPEGADLFTRASQNPLLTGTQGAWDDLWELKDKLEAAGFHVSDAIDHGFIHSIYTHDPNGIPVEFSHNVEEIDIRNAPQMRDQSPSPVPLEGAEPQTEAWPKVETPTPASERVVYPGAGSELFHGKKTP